MTEHSWPGDDGGHHDGGYHDGGQHDGGQHDGAAQDGAHPGVAHDAGSYPAWTDADAPSWEHDASWGQPPDTDPSWPPTGHEAGHEAGHDPAYELGHDVGHDGGHDDTDPGPDTGGYAMGHVGADPDALPDIHDGPDLDALAPSVDVGALPHPVDGFPWVDPAVLGAGTPVAVAPPQVPDDGADLAAYAAQDPTAGGVDWQQLAASDDPAVAALARFWRPAG